MDCNFASDVTSDQSRDAASGPSEQYSHRRGQSIQSITWESSCYPNPPRSVIRFLPVPSARVGSPKLAVSCLAQLGVSLPFKFSTQSSLWVCSVFLLAGGSSTRILFSV